jgi:hypothetical protein
VENIQNLYENKKAWESETVTSIHPR